MKEIKWNTVTSKKDLPKQSRCYYFALHHHDKTHVIHWDSERNTEITARIVSHWADITDLPEAPK